MVSAFRPVQWLCLRSNPLSQFRARPTPISSQCLQYRFQRLIRRSYASRPSKPNAPPRSKSQKPNTTSNYVSSQESFIRSIASRETETVLFQAPRSSILPTTCRIVGIFCIGYGAIHMQNLFVPDGTLLPRYYQYMTTGVALVLIAAGTYVFMTGGRHIGRLTAVPRAGGSVVLRVEPRGGGRFGRPGELLVPLQNAYMRATVREVLDATRMGPARTEAGARALAAESSGRDAEREAHLDEISNPMRHLVGRLGLFFNRLFGAFRRIAYREGILPFVVREEGRKRGRVWKMDIKDGWLVDDGVPLERLIKLQRSR